MSKAYQIQKDEQGNRIYTPEEQRSLDHIEVIKDFIVEHYNILVDAMVFGKRSSSQCILNLMHNLKFYLGIMYNERIANEAIDIIYDDTYYRTEYCIDTIEKRLLCRDIPPSLIKKIMDLYFNTSGSGIGTLEIEGVTSPFNIS